MNAWKQSRWGEPLLENRIDIDEVALILPVQTEKNTSQETGEKTREKTREKIFNAIRESPNITTSELAEKLTITIKGGEWQLKNLREQGFIRRVGPDKGGHWEILKETF
jgi:ATP-dependent DNA helicase RecG